MKEEDLIWIFIALVVLAYIWLPPERDDRRNK
jgi:hypothetical protein